MIPTNNTSFIRGAWAITKQGMTAALQSIEAATSSIEYEDFFSLREPLSIDADGIAVIDVKGAMMDNAPAIYEKIGMTDYRTIRAEISQAKEQGAKAILFKMDTPGGTVSGLKEASNAIKGAGIPTASYCDGMACSAGYYLASATEGIAASPSADVGNIGTVLAWYDDSVLMESYGIKSVVITNEGADLKGTFRDNPMSEAQRDFLQEEVNAMGDDFRAQVEGNREVDSEVFRAGWYQGERAQSLGLIDAVSTFDEARQALADSIS